MTKVFEVGLISDTHGRLRPEAVLALEGCDLILHAGDVCGAAILEELAMLAPCLAVAGNCDDDPTLPLTVLHEAAGLRFFLHHGHLPCAPSSVHPDIIVSGHTHMPSITQVGACLHINPGSAGPRRFNLPVTVARLTITDGRPVARHITLAVA